MLIEKTQKIQEILRRGIKNTISNSTELKFLDQITNAYSKSKLKYIKIEQKIKDSGSPLPRWQGGKLFK